MSPPTQASPTASASPSATASATPATTPSAPATSPSSTPTAVPQVPEAAREAGLVDVRSVIPDAVIDLRYATSDNFLAQAVYPPDARCYVHRTLAEGLTSAAERLRADDRVLVFYDCYRPLAVQQRMWEIMPDPRWVAKPGDYAYSHTAARAVDVTTADPHTLRRDDMGTAFDEFDAASHAYHTQGLTPPQIANRQRLFGAMKAGGLTVNPYEWWHFDGTGSTTMRPHLGVPLS